LLTCPSLPSLLSRKLSSTKLDQTPNLTVFTPLALELVLLFPLLAQVRFRLVPSKVTEQLFWSHLLQLIHNVCEVQQIFTHLETIVQKDEGNRGIQAMCAVLEKDQLYSAAHSLLMQSTKVLILTGFPCCPITKHGDSMQETDGPPGLASLTRCLLHLGKAVHVCVEETSASVVQECLKAILPHLPIILLCELPTKRNQYGSSCVLEIFPVTFDKQHYDRLDELKAEYSKTQQGHMIAIERAGPNEKDGKCKTMRGRAMIQLAPLHLLFINPLCETTCIGDGGNELGMGKLKELKLPSEDTMCSIPASYTLVCSVSNLGAHALCAALCLVAMWEQPSINVSLDVCFGTDEELLQVMNRCVLAGAGDGVTGERKMFVDGMAFSMTLDTVSKLRQVVLDYSLTTSV
jgi:hypothetical protein